MSDKRDTIISKQLSYLLRHGAVKENLAIDDGGYVLLDDLLKHNRLKSLKCTLGDIERIVKENSKQRFSIDEEGKKIRATQGHSIKTIQNEKLLTKITNYEHEFLIHGTSLASFLLILESGCLKKMNRNHIHLSFDVLSKEHAKGIKEGGEVPANQVISGMRYSSQVYIYLDYQKLLDSNYEIFKSAQNEVYLIEADIPLAFFTRIVINSANCTSNKKPENNKINETLILTIKESCHDKSLPLEII